jgi:hypothetical protein
MAQYQAYPLDDAGKPIGCKEFAAADDGTALQIVRFYPDDMAFEVWCESRMVGRISRYADYAGPLFSPRAEHRS